MSRLLSLLYLTLVSGSVLDCSRSNSSFKVTSLSFSPDPAIAGKNSTLIISFNTPQLVTSGNVTYGISYDYLPFHYASANICDTMKCPIQPGKYTRKLWYPLPHSLSGNLRLRITWRDNSTKELMCVAVRTPVTSYSKQLIEYRSKPYLPLPMCINSTNASYKSLVRNIRRSNTTRQIKVDKSRLRGRV